eukprot:6863398-Pyramimonas_sp.AAC.1
MSLPRAPRLLLVNCPQWRPRTEPTDSAALQAHSATSTRGWVLHLKIPYMLCFELQEVESNQRLIYRIAQRPSKGGE